MSFTLCSRQGLSTLSLLPLLLSCFYNITDCFHSHYHHCHHYHLSLSSSPPSLVPSRLQSLFGRYWSQLLQFAFLQFSHFLLVLCSPLSLGKACGGSSCSGTAFTIFSFEIAHVFYYDIIDLSIDNNIEYHLVLSMNW